MTLASLTRSRIHTHALLLYPTLLQISCAAMLPLLSHAHITRYLSLFNYTLFRSLVPRAHCVGGGQISRQFSYI
jgi:hypothetical protein